MAFSALHESWSKEGTTKQEFFELCKEVDSKTEYVPVSGPELRSFDNEEAGIMSFGNSTLREATLDQFGVADVYHENMTTRAPLVAANGEILLTNNRAVAEMANLKGLHGSALVKASKKRDAFVQELVENTKMTAVVRREGAVGKILSIRSDKYKSIPLSIIEDVFNGFMDNDVIYKYKVIGWTMDQDTACLQVEFPDVGDDIKQQYPQLPEKWIPGVFFKSGTTGYTPVSAEMYYRKETGNPVFAGRAFAKHFAAFNKDTFIKKVQNDVWGKYLQMPEKLAAATGILVTDTEKVLKAIFSYIKLNKVFQKKDTETCRYLDKLWETALTVLQAKGGSITLYDVMDTVMDLPDRVTVPTAYRDLLSEACGRAWTYESK